MTDLSTNDVHGRTLTAFFDTREGAQTAVSDLVAAGIPREHVQVTEGGASNTDDTRGFWDELKDMFMPAADRHGYAEGLRRGGQLLAVRTDEANYTKVMNILDRDGAIDMDEREASWRSSGWTGYQEGEAQGDQSPRPGTTGKTAAVATGAGAVASMAATPVAVPRPASPAPADMLRDGNGDTIALYEETAAVAKRDVNHGRVRLRSYVVETPFVQQVNLRSEQVQVERHAVDRPIDASDALFQDHVIEVEEHSEEAILSKQARVKEEISLRKTVENQTQTMSDTLRHTEVEVEDTRGGHALAGVQGAAGAIDSKRIVEHMAILASDGTHVGTVDHLDGPDKIKLAKSTSPDGQHHFVPLAWIDHIDTHVHLNKTGEQVRAHW